jgi:hypothetical protein
MITVVITLDSIDYDSIDHDSIDHDSIDHCITKATIAHRSSLISPLVRISLFSSLDRRWIVID